MDCVFCDIISKKLPAEMLFEDANVVIFKDKNPIPPVHLLVVPKRHLASVTELKTSDRDMVADLIYTAKDMATKLGLVGYKFLFNVGREGGQMVDHLHLHLMAGWKNADERRKASGQIIPGSLDI